MATTTKPVFHWDLAIQGSLAAFIGFFLAAYGHCGRRSDGPQIERFLGPLQVLFTKKFYFDEIYDAFVVRSLRILSLISAFFDNRIIDGLVQLIARIPLLGASFVRQFQSGLLQRYALAGVVGVLAIVVALAWQLRS
jgi:NADH-quinone oxidoreductase subunit L